MNALLQNRRTWFTGLLGAALLASTPLSAQADQGKWWDPQQGGNAANRREADNVQLAHRGSDGDRGLHRGWRGGAPSFHREVVVIRDGYRGRRYRANRVWVSPAYFDRQRLIVVRPVRYYVWAGATIGGVRIDARFRDHYEYGCNFCDARFSDYDAYRRHVVRCDDRPSGYRLDVCDWDQEWNSAARDYDGHDDRDNDRRWD